MRPRQFALQRCIRRLVKRQLRSEGHWPWRALQREPYGPMCAGISMRGLTFELSGRQRQDARPGLAKMYRVPPDRAWWPAVGAPLERGVRPHRAYSDPVAEILVVPLEAADK